MQCESEAGQYSVNTQLFNPLLMTTQSIKHVFHGALNRNQAALRTSGYSQATDLDLMLIQRCIPPRRGARGQQLRQLFWPKRSDGHNVFGTIPNEYFDDHRYGLLR